MYQRLAKRRVEEALCDTPVVMIAGPRRCGKTTLVHGLTEAGRDYVTLDDQTVLEAAKSDPAGLIRGLDRAVIDEVQRAPDLLLAIKKSVDEDYRPGRFLLTGSANVLTLPRIADSLAGRMEIIRMLPLAMAEIEGRGSSFLANLYKGEFRRPQSPIVGDDLIRAVLRGGFPEVIARETERRRQDWMRSYLDSILTRDLRDIAEVERLSDLPKFVRMMAELSGQLINFSQLGASINVSYKSAQRYVSLLEQVFLIATLQPWFTNRLSRLIKTPKIHFLDSGVLAALRGLTFDRIKSDRNFLGPILETFVFSEVMKLMTATEMRLVPFHMRDKRSREVDIVLERDDRMIAGIEVKASATVKASDFAGLSALAEASLDRFAFGAVLYDGTDVVPFGDRLAAVPLSCLWA